MFDIIALGECLIDFTPSGSNEMGLPLYSQNPGGAPANVLAMATRLGCSTAFIGKVGRDAFGSFLKASIEKAGIDCRGLVMDRDHLTTLAFVTLNEKGDRSFSFYRNPGADLMLSEYDVDASLLGQTKVFHFGSVSMTDEPSRSATIRSAKKARESGVLISYDPNYRPLLWRDGIEAAEIMKSALALCDVVKVSDEELELLTGTSDVVKGSKILSDMGLSIVVVTMGPRGSFVRRGGYTNSFRTFDVKTVDTTGAGDAFLGAFLWNIAVKNGCTTLKQISEMPTAAIDDAMVFANAAGSLTTSKKGAIPAMPSAEEISSCIAFVPLL